MKLEYSRLTIHNLEWEKRILCVDSSVNTKLAGKFLALQNNEIFQEAQEGVMGGALAGMGLLGTNAPLPQIGLQTLGGMAGGVALGLLGTRLGARIGKALHPEPLKNQQGLLAMGGRLMGQKTLASGAAEVMRYGKSAVKQELMEQTSAKLMHEALQNPQAFAGRYGIDAETFQKHAPLVKQGGRLQAGLETYGALTDKEKTLIQKQLQTQIKEGYGKVEQLIANQAAGNLDENIAKMAEMRKGMQIPGMDTDISEVYQALLKPATDITGEHVGRAVGRFIGDEIGVLGGMALGGVASNALGIKDEKDKKIEELQRQLGRPY